MFESQTESYDDCNTHHRDQNCMYLTMDRDISFYLQNVEHGYSYCYVHGMHWSKLHICRRALYLSAARGLLYPIMRVYKRRLSLLPVSRRVIVMKWEKITSVLHISMRHETRLPGHVWNHASSCSISPTVLYFRWRKTPTTVRNEGGLSFNEKRVNMTPNRRIYQRQ